jgi:hypothetical protein
MALQDHFRPPLVNRRHWHAFHNAWATYLSSSLNDQLPVGYFAEPYVQFGIEIDVAAFEESGAPPGQGMRAGWDPPQPVRTLPFSIATEIVEVLLFSTQGGPTLVAAIELVSPANKDRKTHRDAFVSRCGAFLRQGLGLVMVDVVTERAPNPHNELLTRILEAPAPLLQADLYATSYRPVNRDGEIKLDLWEEVLAIGKPLPPALPLWLQGGLCLRVDLDTTYERTCREQRVTFNGAQTASTGKPKPEGDGAGS